MIDDALTCERCKKEVDDFGVFCVPCNEAVTIRTAKLLDHANAAKEKKQHEAAAAWLYFATVSNQLYTAPHFIKDQLCGLLGPLGRASQTQDWRNQ